MQMTESEMKVNVLQAKDQRAQVKICAELNGIPECRMKDILKKQGVDLRRLRGAAPKFTGKKKKAPPQESAAESQQITVAQAMAALYGRIGELKKQRAEIDKELNEMSAQLVRMDEAIGEGVQQ